ncbi:ascorbate-dependent monooxygenase [Tundrisphaera sp. TA3]|uniref:ascorbate-dependent monooxygenase n=1 Tax=Tundrisphaera sp. TA3 TaxID=3435775 RepID=UPI003EB98C62
MRMCVAALTVILPGLLTPDAGAAAPTYAREVAPILWKNCAGCHRPGEVGPFSLLTYPDAAKRADFLKQITAERAMPPWKPEPGFGEFHDVRRLTDGEIATIAAWADAGAPEGNPADLPTPPTFPDGWQLGTPDLVLEMSEPFEVPAGGRDVQRCFVIPIPTDSDRTVAAVEFRPGNARVVHHAIFYLDSNGAARRKDEAEPGPGYKAFGGPGIIPTGGLGGWAPGAMVRRLPEGTGKYLRKGSDLVLQVHYHPDGKPELDRSTVGIYFTREPARTIVGGLAVRSRGINIPAGAKEHKVHAESQPLPVPVSVIGLFPHMHNLGREMKVVAEVPGADPIPLIWIKDWDFNWQGQYQYVEPVRLPRGTVIKLDAVYDNSEGNPKNPSSPPIAVHWGEQTTDEMCLLGIQVTADTPADLRKIVASAAGRLGAILVGGPPLGGDEKPGAKGDKNGLPDLGPGFPIPERYRAILGRFDSNNDDLISSAEIDAMPEPIKQRVVQALKSVLPGSD